METLDRRTVWSLRSDRVRCQTDHVQGDRPCLRGVLADRARGRGTGGVNSVQTLTITDWLPDQLANGPHGHWRVRQKKLQAAQTMVWASGKHAGIEPVTGPVRVTVTFVFAQKRRRDTDNLYSRAKGVVDGLVKGGWIEDDNTEVLELHVLSAVSIEKRKSTRITLEPLAAGQANAGDSVNEREGK